MVGFVLLLLCVDSAIVIYYLSEVEKKDEMLIVGGKSAGCELLISRSSLFFVLTYIQYILNIEST
jgi:hypothetical protein